MARIPYSGLEGLASPGTISIPDDYQHITASPDAFGAGVAQAGQVFGQGMQKLGGDLGTIAAEQKAFERNVAVTQAMNTFQQTGMSRIWGDPNNPNDQGFMGLRGSDAATRWGDFSKGLEQARQDAMNALGSDPAAKEAFDRQSRRLAFSFGELGARHRQQQMQQAAISGNQAAVQLSQQDAALRWNDEDAFNHNLADARRLQAAADEAAGAAPEVREANQRKVMSDTKSTRIMTWSQTDPMGASAYLQANKDDLLPSQQIALTAHLRNATKQREVSDYVNGKLPGGTSPTAPYVPATPQGPLPDMIRQSAQKQGVDPSDALAIAKIESNVGQAADRPGSQFKGPFQMGDGAWADRGGTAANRNDPSAQVDLGVANLAHSRDVAQTTLGRAPQGWETYLVHQQGDVGGAALLKADANESAVAALLPAYKGDAAKARAAIMGNGGTPGMNVGEFRNLWQSKFQVARGATGAQIAAAGADQGASAPMQPIQTQADYLRENFDRITEETRAEMMAKHPDDPSYADLAVARVSQRMNQAISAQQKSYEADSHILWQAANGDLAKGVFPGSVDELVRVSPQVQQAWQRAQVQQPQLAHSIATRVLSQNAKPDDKDAKTYGDSFYQQFQRIHARDGDPNKLTNPDDLYGMLGQGLTMSGIEKLRNEMLSKRTPEGEAWSSQQAQFFKVARGSISGADDGLGLKDPKGEQIYLRFMAQAYPLIEAAKKQGKSPSDLFNPDSPDYVGKIIPNFKRTLAQRTADMLSAAEGAQPEKPAEQPGFFGRLFGGPDLSTPEGIRGAFQSGKLNRADALAKLRGLNSAPLTPAETE